MILAGLVLLLTVVLAAHVGLRRSLLGLLILSLTAVRFDGVPWDVSPVRYVAVVALLAVTWHAGQRKQQRLRDLGTASRWLFRGLWLLVVLAIASNAWSISPSHTIPQTAALVSLVALIQLSVTRIWHTVEAIAADMAVVFWALSATVVAGLVLNPATEVGRVYGLYKNPNSLAMTCAVAAAIGLGLLLHHRRPVYLAPLGVLVMTLLLTQSRTSIIALLAGLLFVYARRGVSARLSVVAFGLLLTVGGVVFASALRSLPAPIVRVTDRFTEAGNAGLLSNRDTIWDYAFLLWKRQPVLGYGFRSGEVIFDVGRDATTVDNTVAHSSYLQMLVELGLIGLIPSAVLLCACALVLRRCDVRGLGAGMAAAVVVGLAVGGGESAVFGVGQSFCWALWLAIAAGATLSADRDRPARPRQSAALRPRSTELTPRRVT